MKSIKVEKRELFEKTINFELLKEMKLGEIIYVSPEKADILRSRTSETNTYYKRSGQPYRWTTNTGTSPLGYISVTRIR